MTSASGNIPSAPRWLLLAGLATGAAMAAGGLRPATAPGLPPDAVARVDQRLILRDAWLRAVAAVASERRTPLTEADRRHILDRLIDEELLVQHGVELGLVEQDARLRSTLVSEVMQAAVLAAWAEPDEAALRAYYEQHRERFAPAARLRVQAWRLDASGARAPFEPAVPDALLPLAKLRAYLGPALAEAALALQPGEASARLDSSGTRVVLQLAERQAGAAPPFETVREAVRAEFRRRADEDAVRELLAELRGRTPIVVGTGSL
jgi:hypothetical protein